MLKEIGKIAGRIAISTGVFVTSALIAGRILDSISALDAEDYAYIRKSEREAIPRRYEVFHLDDAEFDVK